MPLTIVNNHESLPYPLSYLQTGPIVAADQYDANVILGLILTNLYWFHFDHRLFVRRQWNENLQHCSQFFSILDDYLLELRRSRPVSTLIIFIRINQLRRSVASRSYIFFLKQSSLYFLLLYIDMFIFGIKFLSLLTWNTWTHDELNSTRSLN